jgi:ubiquinol-cytochrome c reductase iron-sulfur subunit
MSSRGARILGWLAVAVAFILRRRRGGGPSYGGDPAVSDERAAGAGRETGAKGRSSEVGVAALLLAAGALGVAFCLLYALDGGDTQLLGVTLGLGLLAMAAAMILAAQRVLPRETAVETRPRLAEGRDEERQEVREALAAAGDGVSRRRLLKRAAGLAGAGLGAAALVPLDSLGPNVGRAIDTTPWRRGVPLVDESGAAIAAADVIAGSVVTAFPRGADRRELGAPVVVVHLDPATLRLPRGRGGWAPEGLVAYSKICTHAGCAVSLYRSPLDAQTSGESPALVCPCHYSTFDVRRGAAVTFGPAGRPLPQLPLAIASDGALIAAGGLSGPIGPAWWSVRREGPTA